MWRQGAAALAVALKTKNRKTKSMALPASLSAFMGITEPAIFGVNIRFMRAFIAGMIGGACGAAVSSIMNVYATANGVTGLFGFLITTDCFAGYLLTFAVAAVVAFVFSWLMFKEEPQPDMDTAQKDAPQEEEKREKIKIAAEPDTVYAPMEGEVIALSDIPDETFASGALGKGCAINPRKGEVTAPFDGEVSMVFDTKHAIGLTSSDGLELLIHIGINTVELNGRYYDVLVSDGDKIKTGQPLVRFDMDGIEKAGYKLTTPVIITNSDEFSSIHTEKTGNAGIGEKLLTVSR